MGHFLQRSSSGRQSDTRYFVQKKQNKKKACPVKNKTQEALWFAFQEPRWWENNNGIFFPVRLHPESHTHSGWETPTWLHFFCPPKTFKLHVYTREAGRRLARTERSRVSWQGWKISITQPGGPTPVGVGPRLRPQAGKCRNLTLLFFKVFFSLPPPPPPHAQKWKAACARAALTNRLCARVKVLSGECL